MKSAKTLQTQIPFRHVLLAIIAHLSADPKLFPQGKMCYYDLYRVIYKLSQDPECSQHFPFYFTFINGLPYSRDLEPILNEFISWGVVDLANPDFEYIELGPENRKERITKLLKKLWGGRDIVAELSYVANKFAEALAEVEKERQTKARKAAQRQSA